MDCTESEFKSSPQTEQPAAIERAWSEDTGKEMIGKDGWRSLDRLHLEGSRGASAVARSRMPFTI
jgi:uncharacterized protein (DUF1684 family)